jgi:hypothetical protein
MRVKKKGFVIVVFALSTIALAQKNEISFSIGAMATSDQQQTLLGVGTCVVGFPNCAGPFNRSTDLGVSFAGGYTRELFNFHVASLGAEFPILGVPGRNVNATVLGVPLPTISESSLFFTPSARIRFLPSSPISPFFSLGGGLAHHDAAGSTSNQGALQFGGGVDFKTPLPHLGIRAEVRDFWAAGASSGIVTPEHQHNVFAGAGIVLRF